MTNGTGTKSVPKDIRFESFLLKNFHRLKFEKIIYYDSVIVVKDGKRYGKIIICDDSVYTFIEALNTFSVAALFKDIISVEMLSDKPMFIFGNQRNKVIHIRINYYKYVTMKKDILEVKTINCNIPKSGKLQKSQGPLNESTTYEVHNEGNNNSIENTKLLTITSSENKKQIKEHIDYYILNMNSAAFPLLKQARVNYLIRETMSISLKTDQSSLYLSQSLLNRLFDELFVEISLSEKSLTTLQKHLEELIEAGNKYYKVKILFWSKPQLYQFMVSQFNTVWKNLVAIKPNPKDSESLIFTLFSTLNVLLKVFNTYFFETDHFATKSKQLQLNNGKLSLSLIENILCIVAYLNDCDRNIEFDLETSELEVDIDCLKHSITFNSIELFHHFMCSSEMSVSDNDNDPFNTRSLLQLLECLVTFDSEEGIFNKFISHALNMQFIWIFPKMFKFDHEVLTSEKIINIYYFFSSIRIIIQTVPKFLKFFQQEMEEEFEHFVLNDLSFSTDFPLSSVTLKLLKSFQKNMINKKELYIDYFL